MHTHDDYLSIIVFHTSERCEDITRDTNVIYLCYSFHYSLQV
jgi:hypothetical protein